MKDKIRKWDVIIAFLAIFCIIISRLMPISCEESFIPEIVNGINSVSGILVGIVMATMAIFFSSEFERKPFKTRFGVYFIIALGPFAEMWAAYSAMVFGNYVVAIRDSFGGFSIAMGLLFNVFHFFVLEEK